MSYLYPIQVRAEAKELRWLGLASILEGLLPVKFSFADVPASQPAGEMVIEDSGERPRVNAATGVSTFGLPQEERCSGNTRLSEVVVHFVDDAKVPFPFRGRSLHARVAAEPRVLALYENETILASTDRGAVWTVSEEGKVRHFRSGFALPEVPGEGSLRDVLNSERFLELVPWLHWLRTVCARTAFDGPPLRACFIFDDPNLHGSRYGYVDYREIAARAAKENYHVCFATIPLDTWFTHQATAELFRTNATRLSLAVHGNNHSRGELARHYSQEARTALLRQAIQRIERLERSARLRVCRVMVPPHGACSEEMLVELPRSDFEAACISHGSLRAHNESRGWTRSLGFAASELIQGCLVLPRWGFAGNTTNTILLAGFLKQPMILRAHQQDLRDGLELLDQHARLINSLGPVRWSNLTQLCRVAYEWRLDVTAYILKPLSRAVMAPVPGAASRLILERSSARDEERWYLTTSGGVAVPIRPGEPVPLPGQSNRTVAVELAAEPATSGVNGVTQTNPWLLMRRLLTEARDRWLPAR